MESPSEIKPLIFAIVQVGISLNGLVNYVMYVTPSPYIGHVIANYKVKCFLVYLIITVQIETPTA
jgi:hypothetical protein